jgi:hypothetical protein
MPLERHVRNLEGSWEDSVRIDKLSEEWRSHQDVARIDGCDLVDSSEGSLPALLDGSNADGPKEQSLEDLGSKVDAAGFVSYLENTVGYGWIPFGLALSPHELLRRREEYEAHLKREEFGLTRVVHPQIASVVYKGLLGHSWLVPHCFALSVLDSLDCPRCAAAWCGPKHVTVYSLTDVSVWVTFRDSAGIPERRLRTREHSYGWRVIDLWPANRSSHLFGRDKRTIILFLDLNGLTFYRGSCRCPPFQMPDLASISGPRFWGRGAKGQPLD